MDCVVIQVSDLHIKNYEESKIKFEILCSNILWALESECSSDTYKRFLVVTGDIVDSPSTSRCRDAKAILEFMRQKLGVDKDAMVLIPGNHDTKKSGLFGWNSKFYNYEYPMSIYSKECELSLVGFDSTSGIFSRGGVSGPQYRASLIEMKRHLENGAHASDDRPTAVLAIALIHHHPLPIKKGEQGEVMGIRAEPLLQMDNAGAFLDACIDYNFDLVLHGHRHASKFHRYGRLDEKGTWQNLYVLGCASSTGAEDTPPGFNLIVRKALSPSGQIIRYSYKSGVCEPEDLDPNINIIINIDQRASESLFQQLSNHIAQAYGPNKRDAQVFALKHMFSQLRVGSISNISGFDAMWRLHMVESYWKGMIMESLDSDIVSACRGMDISRLLPSSLRATVSEIGNYFDQSKIDEELSRSHFRSRGALFSAISEMVDQKYLDGRLDSQFVKNTYGKFDEVVTALSRIGGVNLAAGSVDRTV